MDDVRIPPAGDGFYAAAQDSRGSCRIGPGPLSCAIIDGSGVAQGSRRLLLRGPFVTMSCGVGLAILMNPYFPFLSARPYFCGSV